MNENLNIDAIRQLLNRSLGQLDQPTLDRLREARVAALARAPARTSPSWRAFTIRHAMATRFATALLVVGLLGGIGYYWQQSYDNNAEADIAILTDDMPINYYVN